MANVKRRYLAASPDQQKIHHPAPGETLRDFKREKKPKKSHFLKTRSCKVVIIVGKLGKKEKNAEKKGVQAMKGGLSPPDTSTGNKKALSPPSPVLSVRLSVLS